ncbi:hypothetical protein FQA39_LY12675 [Lamprigera yunnana]|nr:hypothetical protein FQA39_LY12675 [Lamprigera yunnana]
MSSIDPAKLKVVELRAELTARGLEAKGNKPVLVKRLKDALEKELQIEIPDTSINLSTEDVNTTIDSVTEDVQTVPPDKPVTPAVTETPDNEETKMDKETADELENEEENNDDSSEVHNEDVTEESKGHNKDEIIDAQPEVVEKKEEPEITQIEKEEEAEPDADEEAEAEEEADEQEIVKDEEMEETIEEVTDEAKATEGKGEKRRCSSPLPERVQRKRSKSPIKEDEPVIDNNKVQLSWYDSDLHLQIDKKTFLSGKPYHEGAFGYAWAGARATHGVKTGKVCYEVKITEELKWDDFVKHSDKRRDNRHKENSKKESVKSEKPAEENVKSEKPIEENVKSEKPAEETVKSEKPAEENLKSEKPAEENVKSEKPTEENVKSEKPTEENAEKMEIEETDTKAKSSPVEQIKEEEKEEAEVKVEMETSDTQDSAEVSSEVPAKHLARIGWSILSASLQLGETEFSYSYESTGKYVSNNDFTNYGTNFGVGDVVGAYLNITEEHVTLHFTLNGKLQPDIANIPKCDFPADNFCIFPHILTRNYTFEVNFGAEETPWYAAPDDLVDYTFIMNIEDKVEGPQRPLNRSDCEVIMMCGLPASGKTQWVRGWVQEHLDKSYTLIGNTYLLEKMTVNGNPLKNSHKNRWGVVLDRLMKCVNILVETAALRRRNYIIDQTNVFPSAQRRKMRLFEGFKRQAVVVVVGDDEQVKRQTQQEAQDGKDVPDSAMLEMKANMSLPKRGDWLEEVTFVELNEDDAKNMVQKYNQEGREAGFGSIGSQRSGYRDNRTHPYRWDHTTSRRDYRGGYRDYRQHNTRYDRSRQHGGWQNRRPPPGSWNRDIRRDGRGSSRDYRYNNRSSGMQKSISFIETNRALSEGRSDRSNNRDNRVRSSSNNHYNRNQRPQRDRNSQQAWQNNGSNAWQQQGNWGGQGMWNQSAWSNQANWNNSQGTQASQWKNSGYGQSGYQQGGGYGNYSNWNYYGHYAQNWNSQGQPQTTSGGTMVTDSNNMDYNQYSQEAVWAQYAQQYPQHQTESSHNQQQSLQG